MISKMKPQQQENQLLLLAACYFYSETSLLHNFTIQEKWKSQSL